MIRSIILMMGSIFILIGCEPMPKPDELHKNLVVQTDYDETVNFKEFSTYQLALDTLGLISNSTNDTLFLGEFAQQVTARIKANLDSRGYVQIDKSQNPDLGVNAFIVSDFSVYQTISYPSYGGGYYSPYYGYYYPIVSTYASNSAGLILQLVNLKKKNNQNQFQLIWTCYIGDIASSNDQFNQSIAAVDQAFVQSSIIGK